MSHQYFSFARCWKPEDFNRDEYRRLTVLKGWPSPALVEREMLLYDTLHALNAYPPRRLTFKGGTMISRVYLHEPIRFSWDLDFDGRELHSLEDVLEMLQKTNRRLVAEGATVQLNIGPHKIKLGVFELDREKYVPDRLPSLIPVRRILPSLTLGAELPTYLRKSGLNLQEPGVTESLMEIRRSLGQMLRVEEVRAEIRLEEPAPAHVKPTTIRSLLEPEKTPLTKVTDQPVSSIEGVLADKIDSISKPPAPERMVDMAKDLFDTYRLLKIPHNPETVNERLEAFVAQREDLDSLTELYEKAAQNIKKTRTQTAPIFSEHHLFHPAQDTLDWDELYLSTNKKLLEYAQTSPTPQTRKHLLQ